MSIIRLQGEREKKLGIYFQLDSNDEPIGVGGMGQVYKGICVNERTKATRPVAIKFMYDDLPPQAIERARREASIQLRNDNLVEMLGFIETQGTNAIGDIQKHYHIVSELLTGVSLSDIMEGKTTDRDGNEVAFAVKMLNDFKNDSEHFARNVVMNILSGLMALHDAGYIHRDIDPTNIMLTQDGHIKLIDFGIAKQMRTLTTGDKSLTRFGDFMGKAEYASPELVLGDVRHQNQTTDIYAMGILLYQCITGHPPFEGPRHEVLEQQLKSKIPLGVIKNKALRRIIATACEKKQEDRYQTSAQMRVALESMSTSNHVNWKLISASIAALVVFAIGIASFFLNKNDTQETIVYVKPELSGIAKAADMMKTADTAKDGFKMLNDMVAKNDVGATYLLSRLYTTRKGKEEYDPDSIRTMRQVLIDAKCITCDDNKAHELLIKTVKLDPQEYHALYELGRDCLAGNDRQHEKELTQEDFKNANDFFTRALKAAEEHNDIDYVTMLKEQMELYQSVL